MRSKLLNSRGAFLSGGGESEELVRNMGMLFHYGPLLGSREKLGINWISPRDGHNSSVSEQSSNPTW